MTTPEDQLQEHLEQLEAGTPLETCLANLSETEAQLLILAASLRELQPADLNQEVVSTQRASLLAWVNQEEIMNNKSSSNILANVQTWLKQRTAMFWIGTGVFAPSIILLLIAFLFSFFSRQPVEPSIVEDDSSAIVTHTDEANTEASEANNTTPPPNQTTTLPAIELQPIVADPVEQTPQTAILAESQGLVEIQDSNGLWGIAAQMSGLTAGQRIRTNQLSQATIIFHDGSQAHLGPNTEISIDELDAQRPEQGFRTVTLTQWLGESEHQVAFRHDGGSRYEVRTPAGTGIARGTQFTVFVTADLRTDYLVTEGKVDITSLNQTQSIIAGQMSTIQAGQAPTPPTFYISGEGTVSQTGDVWIIAGQTFQTTPTTIVSGDPQIGDLVYVVGHLLADGTRLADRIRLLQRADNHRFTLTGIVASINNAIWTVAGQSITVYAGTIRDDNIETGDTVRITGRSLEDGTLLAERIALLDEDEVGTPFYFVGLVQQMVDNAWLISGQTVVLNAETAVSQGIVIGDQVAVQGIILDGEIWLARTIQLVAETTGEFEFSGSVQNINPWQVNGIPLQTRPWTVTEPGIEIGNTVYVQGVILEDGTWVATIITLIEDNYPPQTIILVGILASTNPWLVNNTPFIVDDNTHIWGDVEVGILVYAVLEVTPNGTLRAISIRPIRLTFGLGCFIVNDRVRTVNASQITLQNGSVLDRQNITAIGDLTSNSIVTLQICILFDNSVIIVDNTIIVIYQIVIIVPPPNNNGGSSGNGGSDDDDD